jgi:hypothetical protein
LGRKEWEGKNGKKADQGTGNLKGMGGELHWKWSEFALTTPSKNGKNFVDGAIFLRGY